MNPTDVPLATLHDRAVRSFADKVQGLQPDDWGRPTPCTDWDVRALVNHIAVEELWTPPLLAGRTIAEVGDAFDGDQLGESPKQAQAAAAEAATAAVAEPGALDRTVHLSYGDERASEYVWQLTADHLVHAWDLARAVGGDERLDPDLVAAVAAWFDEREETYRAAGLIGARPQVEGDADAQTRLLAAFGREA